MLRGTTAVLSSRSACLESAKLSQCSNVQASQRMSRIDLGMVLGLLLGFAGGVVFASNWQLGLKDYQDLAVGLLSLFGAAAAVLAVMRQIQQAQEMEDDRLRRRNLAARAALPHALSALCNYVELCCSELTAVLQGGLPPNDEQGVNLPRDLRAPAISADVIPALKECIEFGAPDIQQHLADLISLLQVQIARINAPGEFIQGRVVDANYYYSLLGDAFEIRARVDELYPYARRVQEHASGRPNIEGVINAANIYGFSEFQWPNLYRHLRRPLSV